MVEYRGFEIARSNTNKYFGHKEGRWLSKDLDFINSSGAEKDDWGGWFKTEDQVKEAIDKYYAKQDSLSEENSESLEKTYTGREVFEALLEGKKLIELNDPNNNGVIYMSPAGFIYNKDQEQMSSSYIVCADWKEHTEPEHTHQEL